MNFLAHLTLSCQDPALQIGNLLGDFTKGKPPKSYSSGILQGLTIHRLIDHETDQHAGVKALNLLLQKHHGRYAGVVTDVVFDLYLYRHWEQFGPAPFPVFCEEVYANIEEHLPFMPPDIAKRLGNMANHRWLNVYRSPEGILSVFERMKPRMSKASLIEGVDQTMKIYDQQFEDCFLQLFPYLITKVNQACGCSN